MSSPTGDPATASQRPPVALHGEQDVEVGRRQRRPPALGPFDQPERAPRPHPGRGIRVRPDRRCGTDPGARLRRRHRADSARPACRSGCGSRRSRRARAATRAPASTCPRRDRRAGARPRAAGACSRKRAAERIGVVGASGRNARISDRIRIREAAQPRQQIRRQQAAFATVARRGIAGARMQQRADARRIERRQALRAQRGDHAGQHIAHAADRHAGIAGADHAVATAAVRRRCVPAPFSTTTASNRSAIACAAREAIALDVRRRHAEQARGFARMRREDGVRAATRRCRARRAGSAHRHRARSGLPEPSAALEQHAPPHRPAPGPGRWRRRPRARAARARSSLRSTARAIASGRRASSAATCASRVATLDQAGAAAQRGFGAQHDRAAAAVVAADAQHVAVMRPCAHRAARRKPRAAMLRATTAPHAASMPSNIVRGIGRSASSSSAAHVIQRRAGVQAAAWAR